MLKFTLTIFLVLFPNPFFSFTHPLPPPSPIVINCQLFQCNILLQFAFNLWNTVPLRSSFALLRAHQHLVDCRWNRWIGVSIGFEPASFRRYFVYFPKSKDECKEDVAVEPFSSQSDWFLISPYNITLESNVRVMREEELIIILRSGWLLIWKRPWPGTESHT